MLAGVIMFISFRALTIVGRNSCFSIHLGRLVAAFLLLATSSVLAQESPLSLLRAIELALGNSRLLSSQDLAISAAHDMASAVGQLPDPVLKFGIDNLPVNGSDRGSVTNDFMTMRRLGIEQEMTRSEKRELRSQIYERSADKVLAEKNLLRAQLERDTALAWFDRFYAERLVVMIAEQVAQAKLEIDVVEANYRGGRGSQADIFAARSALAMAEDRQSDAARKLRNAKAMLNRWIGSAVDMPLADAPQIDQLTYSLEVLEKNIGHHPQMALLSTQIAIAQTDAKLAEANKKADWSIELTYQQRGPAYSNMVSVGFSLPLQWDQTHRQDRELSSKLAQLEQAKAQNDEALRVYSAEVLTISNEWQNNLQRIKRYNDEIIPLAGQRTQASLASYRGGKTGLVELIAARGNEIDTRLQALQLQADTAHLWAQLNFMYTSASQPPDGGHNNGSRN